MKCKQCGKETRLLNGNGEFYCENCMKLRRIKKPKTYNSSLKKYH